MQAVSKHADNVETNKRIIVDIVTAGPAFDARPKRSADRCRAHRLTTRRSDRDALSTPPQCRESLVDASATGVSGSDRGFMLRSACSHSRARALAEPHAATL
ncbi:hypothetical protein Lfu02_78720 [Longispora fulva]|uniref:Uncharacterized protein n=1 Tax=Longispora fulva TaxID=619741 RepID=A0A8J7GGH2_9ACTN|nr:hypothetical protein [Longispora fulva]MBG6133964.1 hypothetical protein [Longispora fulva]GIG63500.1 hypothetical protein Lfu02_78720 [Longispora fulva]